MPVVRSTGYGARFWFSVFVAFFGGLFFLGSVLLLFFSERNGVRWSKALQEGKSNCVEITDINRLNQANNGKLVHLTGFATTDESLNDPEFGVSATALRLTRSVEIYQYQEEAKPNTGRYSHIPRWVDRPLPSNNFKPDDLQPGKTFTNVGTLPCLEEDFQAEAVKVGAYKLSASQVEKMGEGERLPVTNAMLEGLAPDLRRNAIVTPDGYIYFPFRAGGAADGPGLDPQIGDVRVSFNVLKPATISLLCRQSGDSFEPYTAASGKPIDRLVIGSKGSAEMFSVTETEGGSDLWPFRILAFLIMNSGVALLLRPILIATDVLPGLGFVLNFVAYFIALFFTTPLCIMIVAMAWLFERPLYSIPALVLTLAALGATIFVLFYFVKRRKAAQLAVVQKKRRRRYEDDED